MAGGSFNRHAYVTRQPQPERYRSGGSFLGFLFLVFLLTIIGFAGYMYFKGSGGSPFDGLSLPAIASGPSEQDEILAKLQEIEKRLDRLERRQRTAAQESTSASSTESPPAEAASSSQPSPTAVAAEKKRTSGKSKGESAAGANERLLAYDRDRYGALAADVKANEERWDATSGRLGDTVVELGKQRSDMAEQRRKVNKLWERFERVPIDFTLEKRDGDQRVGPITMRLRGTNQKNHRYTLRVLIDDKWIELKDRALLETIELYMSRMPVPMELVVQQVGDDRISGTLNVPQRIPTR